MHIETYKKSPINMGVCFINKKAPRLGEAQSGLIAPCGYPLNLIISEFSKNGV